MGFADGIVRLGEVFPGAELGSCLILGAHFYEHRDFGDENDYPLDDNVLRASINAELVALLIERQRAEEHRLLYGTGEREPVGILSMR